MLELSELESNRFGLRIARWQPDAGFTASTLRDAVVQARLDVLILRTSAVGGSGAVCIGNTGLPALHADTLVTYSCGLQQTQVAPATDPAMDVRPATRADAPAISELVEQVFASYPNHYTANPLLDPALALAGYCEWALSHIEQPGRLCWLSRHAGQVSGLACSRHDPATGAAIGVLHGIGRDFGNRGIYTDLIRATQSHYKAHGYRTLSISTQVGNLAVQRVWAREGFRLEQVEHTWHLHPLFTAALAAPAQGIGLTSPAQLRSALLATTPATAAGSTLWTATLEQGPIDIALHSCTRTQTTGGHCHVTVALDSERRIIGWAQSVT